MAALHHALPSRECGKTVHTYISHFLPSRLMDGSYLSYKQEHLYRNLTW